MAIKTTIYDTAKYLTTPNLVFYYLEAELESKEAPYLARAVATVARARGRFECLANDTGLSVSVLEQAASNEKLLDREIVSTIMHAFPLKTTSRSKVA